MRRAALLASLWGALLVSAPAAAHPLDVGSLQVKLQGTDAQVTFDLSRPMARKLLDLEETADVPIERIAPASLTSGALTRGGAPCTLTPQDPRREDERFIVPAVVHCEKTGELTWAFPFIDKLPLSFRLLVAADTPAGTQEFILGSGHTTLTLQGAEPEQSFWKFVYMGMQHIGATPDQWSDKRGFHLPDGIDHILFLVALLLSGVAIVPVLKTVTGFTLGHSVTLSLATLGLVSLPSRWVESAIALSIAYVAAEDFWLKSQKPRWKIAARNQLAGALFGFNLGVEIGQEIIVVCLAPILWALFKWKWFEKIGRKVCAGAVLACALVWFYQRAFG